ncbi:MAG TPA: ABC transporter permease [Candidatus Saccharimonadales bacterium]|jgi:putative ABC transport system permease protein
MKFTDYLRMAFRNISRQKLRSSLTIFAVVIGATSVTIMLAIVFSAKGFITDQFEQNGTFQQVAVSPQTDISWGSGSQGNCQGQAVSCIKLVQPLVDQIAKLPHVIGVVRQTHVGNFNGLFYSDKKLRLNQVIAYDTNSIITNRMLAGRDIQAGDGNGVLTITSDYANVLGFKDNYQALIGKTVTLNAQGWYSGVGSDPAAEQKAQQAYFSAHPNDPGQNYIPPAIQISGKIVGVADSNGGPAGDGNSYTVRVPLTWARGMEEVQSYMPAQQQCSFNTPCHTTPAKLTVTDELATNGYDSLVVKVDQATNAAGVAKNIRTQFKVGAADAETAIKQQLGVFNILGAILGGIGGIALVVAAVGVVNTMIMSILERTREIGVMRAVGARRATVSRLFTLEASLLGFLGGVVGLGLGYALILIANPIINNQLKSNGIASSNIITLPLWLILGVILLTTVIGMLAGLYPARRAAKLDPVEALHYE